MCEPARREVSWSLPISRMDQNRSSSALQLGPGLASCHDGEPGTGTPVPPGVAAELRGEREVSRRGETIRARRRGPGS